MSWLADVGRMLGLGSAAGFRPSLTLAIIAVMSSLGWGDPVTGPMGFLDHWITVIVFVLFAIFESAFDKVPNVDRLQDRLTMPYRIVCGGVAGAALTGHGTTGAVLGAALGAAAAFMALRAKSDSRPRSASSEAVVPLLSLREDLIVFAGTALTVLYAWAGYVLFALALVTLVRHSFAERRKYRRLRAGQV